MMPTTLTNDQAAYTAIAALQPAARHIGQRLGPITYAGARWPNLTTGAGKLSREDVDYALGEARQIIARAKIKAKAALRGDTDAAAIMTTWFGARGGPRDWWLGVKTILDVLESNLVNSINVYYRNTETLGQPNDYPGHTGNINAHDISGYAETYANVRDLNIGLCSDFFAKQHGSRTIERAGFDSVGGVLIHELSHNLCGTMDHELDDGTDAYGTVDCQTLAVQAPWRAWYNADNIEYFCEQVTYGLPVTAPVTTGAGTSVSSLAATHAATPTPPTATPPVMTGAGNVKDLIQAHETTIEGASHHQ
jgi:Lysine-specific metallo-endopeptidase